MNIFITTFFKSILIWLLPSISYIYMWFAALFSGRIDEHSAKWGKMVETISKKISYIVPFQLFETTQKCIQKYWLEWSFFSQCSSQQFNPFKTCWAFLKLQDASETTKSHCNECLEELYDYVTTTLQNVSFNINTGLIFLYFN